MHSPFPRAHAFFSLGVFFRRNTNISRSSVGLLTPHFAVDVYIAHVGLVTSRMAVVFRPLAD